MNLFYRIAVTTLSIPSLRERAEDLPTLVAHWLAHLRECYGLQPRSLDDDAYARLLNYGWPGNVRELRNAIEGSMLLSDGPVIKAEKFPAEIGTAAHPAMPAAPLAADLPAQVAGESLKTAEADYIRHERARHSGNLMQTAIHLGISNNMLYEIIRNYKLVYAVSDVRRRGA